MTSKKPAGANQPAFLCFKISPYEDKRNAGCPWLRFPELRKLRPGYLLMAPGTVYLFEQCGLKRWLGILVFMAGGYIVEGNWFAVAVCVTAYRYCQSPTVLRLSLLMVSLVVLGLFINLNQWALAVLPVILIVPHVRISLKRHRHFFYWFYPAHLAVILLARTAIGVY